MIVPEIVECRFSKYRMKVFIGPFTVGQACKHADNPGPAPTRMCAAPAKASVQGFRNGLEHGGIFIEIYLVARIGSDDMGDVPMTRLPFTERHAPLHQAAVIPHFRHEDTGLFFPDLLNEGIIRFTQHLRRLQIIAEHLFDHELIETVSGRQRGRLCFTLIRDIGEYIFR